MNDGDVIMKLRRSTLPTEVIKIKLKKIRANKMLQKQFFSFRMTICGIPSSLGSMMQGKKYDKAWKDVDLSLL